MNRLTAFPLLFLIFLSLGACTNKGNETKQSAKPHKSEVKLFDSFEGQLTLHIAEDFKNHKTKEIYYLTKEKQSYKLEFKNKGYDLKSMLNSTVKVFGKASGSTIEVNALKQIGSSMKTQALNPAAIKGTRKVGYVRVSYQGQEPQCSTQQIEDSITHAHNVFQAQSENTLGFSAHYLGEAQFDESQWVEWGYEGRLRFQILPYLHEQGVDLSQYDHIAFWMPTDFPLWAPALAELGGRHTYYKMCTGKVTAHELGHNLGLHHAGLADPYMEYGDETDVMGGTDVGLNPVHRHNLGWLDNTEYISASGTYDIGASHLKSGQTSLPQLLKIYMPHKEQFLYLAYRTDANMPAEYANKLNVFSEEWRVTLFEQGVDVSQTYTNSDFGFTATVVSKSANSMRVSINLSCVRHPPEVKMLPYIDFHWAFSIIQDVRIQNQDSPGCTTPTDATLSLHQSNDTFVSDIGLTTVRLMPGEHKDTKVTAMGDYRNFVDGNNYLLEIRATNDVDWGMNFIDLQWEKRDLIEFQDSINDIGQAHMTSPSDNLVVAPGSTITFNVTGTELTNAHIYINGDTSPNAEIYTNAGMTAQYTLPNTPNASYVFNLRYLQRDDVDYHLGNTISVQTSGYTEQTDNVNPEVYITSHPQDVTLPFNTSILVEARATDNVAIDRVEFVQGNEDGSSVICTDTTEPYQCDWLPDPNLVDNLGPYIQVHAYDTSGNKNYEFLAYQRIKATLIDPPEPQDAPPLLTITSPADGATVSGSLWLQATASDDVGIVSVKFYIEGQFVKTDTAVPYNYYWDTTK